MAQIQRWNKTWHAATAAVADSMNKPWIHRINPTPDLRMRQTDTHTSHNRQSDVMPVTDGGDTVETAMAGGSLINMKGV